MVWAPGQSGNVNGRPAGSRNGRTKEVIQQILDAGHKDPLITLAELQATAEDPAVRAQAANMLAPYLHSKNAAKPVPQEPVYIQEAISLPRPTTIREAADNISRVTEMKALGQLDFATATSLIEDQKVILYALIDEAKLITAQGGQPEQTIYIEGGLPNLPGTEIIMPPTRMNGKNAITPDAPPGDAPDPEAQGQDPPPGSTEP
jgi:hypothetical protein